MKKIALISLFAVATTAAFAQGTRTDTKTVSVSVGTYANVSITQPGGISVTDGGQAGTYNTSSTFAVVNNIHVLAATTVTQGTLTSGVASHSSLISAGGSQSTTVGVAAPGNASLPLYIWIDGVTLSNSHDNDAASFSVTVTLTEG